MKKIMAVFAFAVLGVAGAAQTAPDAKAEKKPAPAAAPATNAPPSVAPEMERLIKIMSGRWEVDELFAPGPYMPKGGAGRGMEMNRPGPGGFSLITDYRSLQGDNANFTGHGIIAWIPAEKAIKSYWVDSMTGASPVLTGTWVGEELVLKGTDVIDGKQWEVRQVCTDIKPDSHTWYFEMGLPGKKLERVMTFTYKRGPENFGMERRRRMLEEMRGMPPPPPPGDRPKQQPPDSQPKN